MTSMVRSRSRSRTIADEVRADGTRAIIITDTTEETIEKVPPVITHLNINHMNHNNIIMRNKSFEIPIIKINGKVEEEEELVKEKKVEQQEDNKYKSKDSEKKQEDNKLINNNNMDREVKKEEKIEEQGNNKSNDNDKKQEDNKLIISNNNYIINEVKEGKKVDEQEKSKDSDKKQEDNKLIINGNIYIINEVKEGTKVEQEDNKLIINNNNNIINEAKKEEKVEEQENNKSKDNDKKQEDNKLIINNNNIINNEVKKEEKVEEQENNKSKDNDKKQEDNKLIINNNNYIINEVKEGKKVEEQEKSKDDDKKQEDKLIINNNNYIISEVKKEKKVEEQEKSKDNDKEQENNKLIINDNKEQENNDKKQDDIKLLIINNDIKLVINSMDNNNMDRIKELAEEEQEKPKDNDKNQEDKSPHSDNYEKVKRQPKIPTNTKEKLKFILLFIGLSFGIFLAALDQTIIVTTLPAIAKEFRKFDQITWIGTAYLLTATASQPTYAKLTDIFGRKGPFLTAVIIFVIGSVVCGAAPDINALIVGRAIAGLGSGGIFGLVLVIVAEIVPTEQRGKYQGIIGGFFAISSAIGPILGGIFADYATWRWSFYINVPLSAITLITVIFFFHPPNNNEKQESLIEKLKRVDWWGTLVLTTSTFLILLAFNWGGAKYEWYHPGIIVLLCVGGIGFLLFTFIEGYVAKEPLTPALLFKKRSTVASFAVTFFQGMSFFTLVYFVPLYFQLVKGSSATISGVELLPYILATVFATIFSGILITLLKKTSYCTHLCILGSVLITIGTGLVSTFTENSTRGELTGYLMIAGIGAGLIMPTTISFVQTIVPEEHIAAASCLVSLFRTIGGVFGIAILGVILNNDINNHMNDLVGAFFNTSSSPSGISQQLTPFLKDALSSFNDVDIDNLPPAVKIVFMRIFAISFQTAFKVGVVMCVLCFVSSILMLSWNKIIINLRKK